MAERDNQGGYVPADGPIEGRVHAGEYVFTSATISTYWLTANEKRHAIESAEELRRRLRAKLRDPDDR